MEPNLDCHRTEYQRLASTSRRRERQSRSHSSSAAGPGGRLNTGGSEVSWRFTGKPFTNGISNRDAELKTGCGIYPRVHPDEDPRISEVPVKSRLDLRFATTALAAQGGLVPRNHQAEEAISQHKRHLTTWHEHDHGKSGAAKKHIRPLRVAGVSSARLGYTSLPSSARVGTEDRPTWMPENEDLPGGYLFTPSDPHSLLPASARGRGASSRFGRTAHFTATFTGKSR